MLVGRVVVGWVMVSWLPRKPSAHHFKVCPCLGWVGE